MPQGAKNAANHFARMVEKAFGIYKTPLPQHIR
jgi:hypothetical protein